MAAEYLSPASQRVMDAVKAHTRARDHVGQVEAAAVLVLLYLLGLAFVASSQGLVPVAVVCALVVYLYAAFALRPREERAWADIMATMEREGVNWREEP